MIPTKIRGTKQIMVLFTTPAAPSMLLASIGENTNADIEVGINVFLIKLVNPNTNPKKAPFFGPQKIAPKITGIWIIVPLITTKGINPNGVNAITTIMAVNKAVRTSS